MIGTELLISMKFELILLALILFIFLLKLGKNKISVDSFLHLMNGLLFMNLLAGFFGNSSGVAFAHMFATNNLIVLEKNILNLGTLLISMQSFQWLKTHKHIHEFYILLLSTLLGMFFMISAQNILMLYLGLELSTIPLTALANFDLEKKRSGEAAFKYNISSAFSSALFLFGISFLYGATGTLNYSELAQNIGTSPLEIFAFLLIFAGFAFKISAVPFHLWTADVYEGSPVGVTSYLSVVSKAAVLFVLVSFLYTVFQTLFETWYVVLLIISVLTMLIGNLFAIRQNNLKRFLAYSSVTQVGFILFAISANSQESSASLIYFILIYLFSNLGAFGVINYISSKTGKELISDYRGLHKKNPVLAWILAICLFSLAGIPPTAGFFGKFFLVMAGAEKGNYYVVTFAALNMVISLFYYLKVVKAMFMEPNEDAIQKLEMQFYAKLALAVCVAGVLITGFVGGCYEYIYSLL